MEASMLKRQQILLFMLLFWGYTLYILTRKSLSFNIPNIKMHENIKSGEIGILTSALALGYAVGKFVSGVMVDFGSPKQLFSLGLCICGLINVSFSYFSSMKTLVFLSFANGLFQGFGWPSCAKLLKRWYNPKHFGTLWSILSASMNVAGSVGPILSNIAMDVSGSWRFSMAIYGTVSIILAGICFVSIQDSPKDFGFTKEISDSVGQPSTQAGRKKTPTLGNAIQRIVRSPVEYIMSLGFLACLLCKGVMSDWGPIYLITVSTIRQSFCSLYLVLTWTHTVIHIHRLVRPVDLHLKHGNPAESLMGFWGVHHSSLKREQGNSVGSKMCFYLLKACIYLNLQTPMTKFVHPLFFCASVFSFLAYYVDAHYCLIVPSSPAYRYHCIFQKKDATREMTWSFITAFQIGGFTGNITSGAITDWIKLKLGALKRGHPRNFLLIPLIALLMIFVGVLCFVVEDMTSQYTLVTTSAFIIGYAVFSLISIVGVTVVEISASDISGTSHAVAALFGNVGLILSGLPFTIIAENFSWNVAFMCIEGVMAFWLFLALFSQFIEYEIGEIREKVE